MSTSDPPQTVRDFIDVASRYCSLVEDRASYDAATFLFRVQELLPLLYHAALNLPEDEPGTGQVPRLAHEEWSLIYNSLEAQLGDCDGYWEIFDPFDHESHEPLRASLASDLAEIYEDLKPGLVGWREGDLNSQLKCIWDWRFGFESHWGTMHLVDALKAVTWLAFQHELGAPTGDS